MRLIFVLVYFNVIYGLGASDSLCTSRGGSCQQDNLACSGSYVSGLCAGNARRRCCVPASGAGDSRCTSRGGSCQEDNLSCSGSYVTGLCAGHSRRRCCVPSQTSAGDSMCTSRGGSCQEDNLSCSGSYLTGLCAGHSRRRCCVPSQTSAGDSRCTSRGGSCQEDNLSCSGSYVTGLCAGHSRRRCCVPSQTTSGDSRCTSQGGSCQEDSLTCSGSYVSGLCAGHASRRCCLPRSTQTLDCTVGGNRRYSATGSAYYPDNSPMEGGFVDMRGRPLETLQDFLDGSSSIVTVAMDNQAGIGYDTKVCIPQLNRKYGRVIDFRVRDTGGAFANKGYSRIDICVRTRSDSYDSTINGPLTLVFP